jgi:hypothetical protein
MSKILNSRILDDSDPDFTLIEEEVEEEIEEGIKKGVYLFKDFLILVAGISMGYYFG